MAFNIQTLSGLPVGGVAVGDGSQYMAVSAVGTLSSGGGLELGYQLGVTQVLALSATAQASSAWGTGNGQPAHVRVIGTNAFYLAVGTTPVATSASPYFGINTAGVVLTIPDTNKVSVLQAATGGSVWVTVVT